MQSIKQKAGILAGIFFLIAMVMLTNFSDRREYDTLDNTVGSIYKDRLVTSEYLFRISNHLYQKKIWLQENSGNPASSNPGLSEHDKAIGILMQKYESTYLTPEEKKEWKGFKTALQNYNSQVNNKLNPPLISDAAILSNSFQQMENHLNHLIGIQSSEGHVLHSTSRKIISDTRLNAWMEMAMLFVISIALLRWSGFNEKLNHLNRDRALLN